MKLFCLWGELLLTLKGVYSVVCIHMGVGRRMGRERCYYSTEALVLHYKYGSQLKEPEDIIYSSSA